MDHAHHHPPGGGSGEPRRAARAVRQKVERARAELAEHAGHGPHVPAHEGKRGDHGGHHAHMVADFRRRFCVSLVLTAPVLDHLLGRGRTHHLGQPAPMGGGPVRAPFVANVLPQQERLEPVLGRLEIPHAYPPSRSGFPMPSPERSGCPKSTEEVSPRPGPGHKTHPRFQDRRSDHSCIEVWTQSVRQSGLRQQLR